MLIVVLYADFALIVNQVYEELSTLGQSFGLRAEVFHGGASYGPQESALRSGIDILVATPGRAIDHLQRGTLDLGNVQHAVLDEADEMLNMGFADDIESIFSYVNVSNGSRWHAHAATILQIGSVHRA